MAACMGGPHGLTVAQARLGAIHEAQKNAPVGAVGSGPGLSWPVG